MTATGISYPNCCVSITPDLSLRVASNIDHSLVSSKVARRENVDIVSGD